MDLLKYKLYVSHCLMEMKPKSDHQQKTGRQSSTCASSSPYKWKTAEERPVNEVQNDGVQYLPKVYDKKKRLTVKTLDARDDRTFIVQYTYMFTCK